jgi:DNA transformation protein and related proteins
MGKTTTSKDDSFVEFVCDQLDDFEIVTYKAMFGGYGIYCGDIFFAIVFDGRLYFKTNAESQTRYEEWDSEPFQPNAKQRLKSYYEVPGQILEKAPRLVEWAEEAYSAATSAKV